MKTKSVKTTVRYDQLKGYTIWFFGVTLCLMLALVVTTVHIDETGLHASLFDDAMISYRYAQNIANGIGPYWNAGDRVEGFTNPLWTYVMSLFFLISGKNVAITPLIVQVFGALLISTNVAFCSFISHRISRNLSKDKKVWAYLAAISPLLFYPNIYWTIMGMENAFITPILCILFSILFLYEEMPNWCQSKHIRFGIIFSCVLAGQLTRPDFLLAPLAFSASYCLFNKKGIKSLFSVNIIACYSGLAFAGFLTSIWRNFYFDSRLPNTYILKVTGVPLYTQIVSGIGFVKYFVVSALLILLIGVLLGIAERKKNSLLVFSSIAYFGLVLLYQVRVGGDPWNYWRVFTGAVVVSIFAICLTMLKTNENYSLGLISDRKMFSTKLIVIFLIGSLSINLKFIKSDLYTPVKNLMSGINNTGIYTVRENRDHIATALTLRKILPPGSTIGVFWAGTIPAYLPNYYATDFLGKSESHIAKMPARDGVSWLGMLTVPGHNKYDLKYTLNTYKPAWIQNAKWGEDDLTKDPKFFDSYSYCNAARGFLRKEFAKDCPS